MSPEAKRMTIGWGVVIALAGFCLALLGGFFGGGRAAGQIEARVRTVEQETSRHDGVLHEVQKAHHNLETDVAAEVSALKTDVKYIVKIVDAIQLELRQGQ